MNTHVRDRFWIEVILATVIGGLAVLTAVWPSWFEGLSATDPDGGDGALEWTITLGCVAVAVSVALISRWEWRRHRAAALS
jgi:uncharacterized membrane protein YozB (DUF420 family)